MMKHLPTFWCKLLFSTILFWGTAICRAQTFTNIRATQTMTVRALTQAPNGDMWFASGKTLYRFDGEKIYPYQSPVLDLSGVVNCLYADEEQLVRIGCERGLVLYYPEKNQFEKVAELSQHNVRTIIPFNNSIWIGTDKGLFREREKVVEDIDILALTTSGNDLLIGTMQGLKRYDAQQKMHDLSQTIPSLVTCFAPLQHPTGEQANSHTPHSATQEILSGTVNGILRIKGNNASLQDLPDALPIVKCLNTDTRGHLLAGCDGGLFEISDTLKPIKHDARNSRSLSGDVVWCMAKDHAGNLWLGTDNGLSVMAVSQSFSIYPLSSITDSGKGNQIHCMFSDSKGRLWLGGTNGIIAVTDYQKGSQSFIWYEMNSESHPIPHNRIRAFYEDPVWGIWACTDGGLLHYEEDSRQWQRFLLDADPHNWVYDIYREAEALIVTTYDAVYRVKPDLAQGKVMDLQKLDAEAKHTNPYNSTHIGDAEWSITANGLKITREGEENEIDLPEKFVSVYYDADEDLLFLGGADQFAIIDPSSFLQHQHAGIWFSPDARIVEEQEERDASRFWWITTLCALGLLVMVTCLYIRQRRKTKIDRERSRALLASAREKALKLELDNSSLQQKLRTQQLMAYNQQKAEGKGPEGQTGNGGDSKEEAVSMDTSEGDLQYLMRVTQIIEDNIDNPDLSVSMVSEMLGTSSKQLYRRIKQCTDLTAVEYIRKQRLLKATKLLQRTEFTINEVMYMVGFTNPSYFSRTFASEYGMSPSEYRNSIRS